jgi:flagellar protein FliS
MSDTPAHTTHPPHDDTTEGPVMNTLSTPRQTARQPSGQQSLRARFTDGGLATASGPKVIQLCYDRLDRDIDAAVHAMDRRDIGTAHETLCHAQDIVHELLCMLDLDRWEHAASLASIYRYVLELLTQANVKKNPMPAREARHLLSELGEAFRVGGASVVAEPVPVLAGASSGMQFSARA